LIFGNAQTMVIKEVYPTSDLSESDGHLGLPLILHAGKNTHILIKIVYLAKHNFVLSMCN